MNTLSTLLLGHAEPGIMILLYRVVFEECKDENRRSSIIGSGLLDCMQWLHRRVNFLPLNRSNENIRRMLP